MEASVLVLIAENEAAIRDILQASFEDGGFAVTLASSGEEAIAAMDAHGGAVRALITDIKLGSKMTGRDVASTGER
jgi:CheY-like chemotaxis protein